MEDAMVINKSSYERGFAHGTVIKVERSDLKEPLQHLCCLQNKPSRKEGLPVAVDNTNSGQPY
jgi:DNA-directed RNA polymerase beta subunit